MIAVIRSWRLPRSILGRILISIPIVVSIACGGDAGGILTPDESERPIPARLGPSSITKIQGDNQSLQVDQTPPEGLVVMVQDRLGNGIGGVEVLWAVTEGGGTLGSTRSTTNASGRASQKSWVLGSRAGSNQVSASVPGLPSVSFSAVGRPGPVTSLALAPDQIRTWIGRTIRMSVEARDAWGNEPIVHPQWTVADPTVASVSSEGVVTGIQLGTTQVIATAEGVEATAQVDVTQPSNVTVSIIGGDTQEGVAGEVLSIPLSVRIVDEIGLPLSGFPVGWEFVNGGGGETPIFTIESAQETLTTVTDGNGIAGAYWLLGTQAGLNHVIAHFIPDADPSVWGVSGNSVGVAGFSTEEAVEFSAIGLPGLGETIEISLPQVVLSVGQDLQVSATVKDHWGNLVIDPSAVRWEIDNPRVLALKSDGLVTAVGGGQATLTAYSGSASASVLLTVALEDQPSLPGAVSDLGASAVTESTITLSWTQVSDGMGEPADYRVRYGSPTVSWAAGGSQEITVSGDSVGSEVRHTIAGLAPDTPYEFQLVGFRGTLGVDEVEGSRSNVLGVRTAPMAKGITWVSISPPTVAMTAVGQTAQLTYAARDSSENLVPGVSLVWSSSDPSIASVDAGGKVTAHAVGQVLVMGLAACCGASDTVAVNVSQVPSSVAVSPGSMTLSPGQTFAFSATVKDNKGNPIPGAPVAWSSSNTAVASVDSNGRVIGASSGSAQIRAQSGALTGTATVFVGSVSQGSPLFADDFEKGDLSYKGNGFSWGARHASGVNNTSPMSGNYAAYFRFEPQPSPNEQDGWGEIRFDFGRLLTEFWMEYYIKIPSNYAHHGDNYKWLWIWDDGTYPGDATSKNEPAMEFQAWPDGGPAGDISFCKAVFGAREAFFSPGSGSETSGWISAADRGNWVRIRYHMKLASSASANDGAVEIWKNDTKFIDRRNIDFYGAAAGSNGFQKGYLMGWANNGDFRPPPLGNGVMWIYIDNFKVWSTNPGW